MQLLVSVSDAVEALAALRGGADLIDAKNPRSGALGRVSAETFASILAAVGGERPVTAALDDVSDESAVEPLAREFAEAGASFLKIGFAGIRDLGRVAALTSAAVRGARRGNPETSVVAVAYADRHDALGPTELAEAAVHGGARGLLIDTAVKNGPGLTELVAPPVLGRWAEAAHSRGLFVALAGKLGAEDLDLVRAAGADIAGVRGAACDGSRLGRVLSDRVRLLGARCALAGAHGLVSGAQEPT